MLAIGLGVMIFLQVRPSKPVDNPQTGELRQHLVDLVQAQQSLVGKVEAIGQQQVATSKALTDTLSDSQHKLSLDLHERLAAVEAAMTKNLAASSKNTAESLAGLAERLATIDKAQDNIKALSEQVVSLQHVLDDNPARGAFGEMQLADIVESMLPSFAYELQASLMNGKRVDCLILLPNPPGPISVDAKFPLKAYQEMLAERTESGRDKAARQLTIDTKNHIRAIAEKYVRTAVDEHRMTADNALMFIPSEAVYGELHAHHPTVIAESHKLKVYLVSPTTLMATLTTVRAILRDVEMRKQASAIQSEVGTLLKDIARLGDRVVSLDRHFGLASRDIEEIKTSTRKISSRGDRIENLDLSESQMPVAVDDGDALPISQSHNTEGDG